MRKTTRSLLSRPVVASFRRHQDQRFASDHTVSNTGGVLDGRDFDIVGFDSRISPKKALIRLQVAYERTGRGMDDPTESLWRQMIQKVAVLLAEIENRGISSLLAEQKLANALNIAHRVYVMGDGQIVFDGTSQDQKGREDVRKEWLEV